MLGIPFRKEGQTSWPFARSVVLKPHFSIRWVELFLVFLLTSVSFYNSPLISAALTNLSLFLYFPFIKTLVLFLLCFFPPFLFFLFTLSDIAAIMCTFSFTGCNGCPDPSHLFLQSTDMANNLARQDALILPTKISCCLFALAFSIHSSSV